MYAVPSLLCLVLSSMYSFAFSVHSQPHFSPSLKKWKRQYLSFSESSSEEEEEERSPNPKTSPPPAKLPREESTSEGIDTQHQTSSVSSLIPDLKPRISALVALSNILHVLPE